MSDRNKGASDDGVVTSAPASSVGSLLTDLLNEAKKEVAEERVSLERQIQEKEDEERLVKERDEARKRETMQRQLIEETRRRNEALTRKEREEAKKRAAAAQKAKPKSALTKIVAPPQKKAPLVAIIAAAVVIVGIGATAAIAMSGDPNPMKLPDIRAEAGDVVGKARLQWENRMLRIKKEAAELRAKQAEGAALSEKEKRIMAEDNARVAREEARSQAAESEAAAVLNAKKGRRPGKKNGGRVKIDTSVFGGK